MIDPGLEGKVALVTGANHGIGAATAKALAAQGVAVLLHYYRIPLEESGISEEEARNAAAPGKILYRARQAEPPVGVLDEIRASGGRAEALEADLADVSVIPQLFDRAEAAFGPVEVLVNNAAHCLSDTFLPEAAFDPESWLNRVYPLETLTVESHDRHFAVNSRAVALMMTEFARRHAARGGTWGRIVNVSTDAAERFPGEISYGASKLALEAYSRAAASELGRYGIAVNIVAPGPIQTGYIDAELEAMCCRNTPLGRVGVPEDVADLIVFLASDQARWVTGQRIFVGGGHRM